jgi:succinate dehydrogenase/fumarate reductase flavoprotein subunit
VDEPLQQSSWFFGAEKVGLLYPISDKHMVWTASAPIRLVQEAGVDFDPSNGGRFRASTQAIDGVDNALEVCLITPTQHKTKGGVIANLKHLWIIFPLVICPDRREEVPSQACAR